jgi:hypothetical protein
MRTEAREQERGERGWAAFARDCEEWLAKKPGMPHGVRLQVLTEEENGRPWFTFTPSLVARYVTDFERGDRVSPGSEARVPNYRLKPTWVKS